MRARTPRRRGRRSPSAAAGLRAQPPRAPRAAVVIAETILQGRGDAPAGKRAAVRSFLGGLVGK